MDLHGREMFSGLRGGKKDAIQGFCIQFIPLKKKKDMQSNQEIQFIHLGAAKSSQITLPLASLDRHYHLVQKPEAVQLLVP